MQMKFKDAVALFQFDRDRTKVEMLNMTGIFLERLADYR